MLPRTGISPEFIYAFLWSDAFAGVFESLVTGTSGSHQRVKPQGLLAMGAVVAPPPAIHEFTNLVQPLLRRVHRGREESHNLNALRDTLLPKLISGELRVKEIEPISGE